jgi:hypothetical protein
VALALNNGFATVASPHLFNSGSLLSYSKFGVWAIADSSTSGRTGVYAIGAITPIATMPIIGSATYNGYTFGVGSDSGVLNAPYGSVQITANFSTGSMAYLLSILTTERLNAPSNPLGVLPLVLFYGNYGSLPNLSGSGSISGQQHSGSLTGGTYSGTINGTFYGPNAQETTGTWKATSTTGASYIGAFGAKQ